MKGIKQATEEFSIMLNSIEKTKAEFSELYKQKKQVG